MALVKGNNVLVQFNIDGNGYKTYACGQEVSMDRSTETLSTITEDSGIETTWKKGLSTWKLTLNGVFFLLEPSKITGLELLVASMQKDTVLTKVIITDKGQVTQTIEGYVLFPSYGFTAAAGQLVKDRIEMLGSGTFKLEGAINYGTLPTGGNGSSGGGGGLQQLSTPTILSAIVISPTQINLSWQNVANETGYTLQRSLNGSSWATIASPITDTAAYNDTGLSAQTTYYYRLRALGNGTTYANSGYSYINATTQSSGLPQIATPSINTPEVGDGYANVTWSDVSNETGYTLQRATNAGFTTNLTTYSKSAGETSQSTSGENGIQYFFRVKALGNGTTHEDSNWSATVYGTPGVLAPTEFNTTLSFVSETGPSAQGVSGTAGSTNANMQFQFNSISPRSGLPATMFIYVGGVAMVKIDFTGDYLGQPFRYVHTNGATYENTFINGDRNF